MPLDKYRQTNLTQWNERTGIHWDSTEYDVAGFVADRSSLSEVVDFDRTYLGDVAGKELVHLQCHFGRDTLSWARLGAMVTGLDYSPAAIEKARALAASCGIDATFVEAELYDARTALGRVFDIVYTGTGALTWLPDIRAWASVVASLLRPGGFIYVRDGHPMEWTIDDERDDGDLVVKYPYFETREPVQFRSEKSYAGDRALKNQVQYGWNHGLGETVTALIEAGLRIDFLHEFDETEWKALPGMVRAGNGRYHLEEGRERLPLSFAIKATRD